MRRPEDRTEGCRRGAESGFTLGRMDEELRLAGDRIQGWAPTGSAVVAHLAIPVLLTRLIRIVRGCVMRSGVEESLVERRWRGERTKHPSGGLVATR